MHPVNGTKLINIEINSRFYAKVSLSEIFLVLKFKIMMLDFRIQRLSLTVVVDVINCYGNLQITA